MLRQTALDSLITQHKSHAAWKKRASVEYTVLGDEYQEGNHEVEEKEKYGAANWKPQQEEVILNSPGRWLGTDLDASPLHSTTAVTKPSWARPANNAGGITSTHSWSITVGALRDQTEERPSNRRDCTVDRRVEKAGQSGCGIPEASMPRAGGVED
ncbi:hypothetical protein MKX08_009292 [Trichoderma sp. CBMAI-0020]|nr:hypothetical protein MKX08_009292 [Trichoderma sp. CBMAI-0020]